MEIGVGLDASLNLSFPQQADVSREAARLGYTSIWTPEGTGQDSFQVCAQRWAATREVVPEGLATGIAVSPVMYRTPVAFAMSAGTLTELTGGRFILGSGGQNVGPFPSHSIDGHVFCHFRFQLSGLSGLELLHAHARTPTVFMASDA